jgi:hypothetical protein
MAVLQLKGRHKVSIACDQTIARVQHQAPNAAGKVPSRTVPLDLIEDC